MNRPQLIKLIHVGKRELGIDEDTYRDMLYEATGVSSCSNMTDEQLENVLRFFKSKGFNIKTDKPQTDPQAEFIRSLWREMNTQGIIKSGTEESLRKYIYRITGVEALEWCSIGQKRTIIETLKKWQIRGLNEKATGRTAR